MSDNEKYLCPICYKEYKTVDYALNHMRRKECEFTQYSIYDVEDYDEYE